MRWKNLIKQTLPKSGTAALSSRSLWSKQNEENHPTSRKNFAPEAGSWSSKFSEHGSEKPQQKRTSIIIVGQLDYDPAAPALIQKALQKLYSQKIPTFYCKDDHEDTELPLINFDLILEEEHTRSILKSHNIQELQENSPKLHRPYYRDNEKLDHFLSLIAIGIAMEKGINLSSDTIFRTKESILNYNLTVKQIELNGFILKNGIPYFPIDLNSFYGENIVKFFQEHHPNTKDLIATYGELSLKAMEKNLSLNISGLTGNGVIICHVRSNQALRLEGRLKDKYFSSEQGIEVTAIIPHSPYAQKEEEIVAETGNYNRLMITDRDESRPDPRKYLAAVTENPDTGEFASAKFDQVIDKAIAKCQEVSPEKGDSFQKKLKNEERLEKIYGKESRPI